MYRSCIFRLILSRCLQLDLRTHSFNSVPPQSPSYTIFKGAFFIQGFLTILLIQKIKWIFDHILPFSQRHFSFQYTLTTVDHDLPTVDHNLSSCFLPTYSNNRQSLFTNGRSNFSCLLFFSKNSV